MLFEGRYCKQNRASKRIYTGPPLMNRKAIKAEETRQKQLTAEFNKVATRWTIVRQRANIKYLKWSNKQLENGLKDAEFDTWENVIKRDDIKIAVTEVNAKN